MRKLKEKVAALLARERARRTALLAKHGARPAAQATVASLISGGGLAPVFLSGATSYAREDGWRIHGRALRELAARLPEEIFWLRLTGEWPSADEVRAFRAGLAERCRLPDYVWRLLEALPSPASPLALLNAAVLALASESVVARRGADARPALSHPNLRSQMSNLDGDRRNTGAWEAHLEDALNLVARLPCLAAYIYRRHMRKGPVTCCGPDQDWGAAFVQMLGLADPRGESAETMRWLLAVHSLMGMGSCGAAAAAAVSSAQADMYLVVSAALAALGGQLDERSGPGAFSHLSAHDVTVPAVERLFRSHGLEREADEFCGALLRQCGLNEPEFFPVVTGVGRAFGICAEAVLARGLWLDVMPCGVLTLAELEKAAEQGG